MLEGSTWAINARLRLTHRLSMELTQTPPYPKDAVGTPGQMLKYLIIILIVLAVIGVGCIGYFDYVAQQEKRAKEPVPISITSPTPGLPNPLSGPGTTTITP